MFIIVPDDDKDVLDLLSNSFSKFKRANRLDPSIHECVLLTVIELEGSEERVVFTEYARLPAESAMLLEEIEKYAAESVFSIRKQFPNVRNFFCTIAEYDPKRNAYNRAVTGSLYTSAKNLN